ncbi:MAG: hypothetical protein AAGG68_23995 [Bacteroidota bacterium]
MEESIELTKITLEKWKIGVSIGSAVVSAVVLLYIAIRGYQKGFKVWLQQKKEERKIAVTESRIEAFKAVWSLIEYYPVKKQFKEKSFIKKEKISGASDKYFLIPKKAKEFINRVSEIFYEQGHGIFLDASIRDALFDIRDEAVELLRKYGEVEESIEFNDAECRKKMNDAREILIKKLREEVTKC